MKNLLMTLMTLMISLALLPTQAAAQARAQAQTTADGRSIVGQEPSLLSRLAPEVLLTGLTAEGLDRAGRTRYPEIAPKLNRPGHAMGAFILTQRYGFLEAQTLGIANELWEAWALAPTGHPYFSTTRFDLVDVTANVYGGVDGLICDWNTPWGFVRAGLWLEAGLEAGLLEGGTAEPGPGAFDEALLFPEE